MTIILKPPHGKPCNNCGLCCMSVPCPVAKIILGQTTGYCRALEHDGQRYVCGLVVSPMRYAGMRVLAGVSPAELSETAAYAIGSGTGCDAFEGSDDDPQDKAFTAHLNKLSGSKKSGKMFRRLARAWRPKFAHLLKEEN